MDLAFKCRTLARICSEMNVFQLLLVLCVSFGYFSFLTSCSTSTPAKIPEATSNHRKLEQVKTAYKGLVQKIKVPDMKLDSKYDNIENDLQLVASTIYLIKKYPEGTEKPEDFEKIVLKFDLINSLDDAELHSLNFVPHAESEKCLDDLIQVLEGKQKITEVVGGIGMQKRTWFGLLYSFHGLVLFIAVSLVVISVFTWQFYKKTSAEDL